MIRIVTARSEAGFPTDHAEFAEVQADTVPMILGLRFDKELAAMAKEGLFPGVNRWSEAAWKCQKFSVDCFNWLKEHAAEKLSDDPEMTAEDNAIIDELEESEDFSLWMASHPYYALTVRVGIWAAVNMSGKHMTLREVYELSDSDYDSTGFDEPFIDDDKVEDVENEAGKA